MPSSTSSSEQRIDGSRWLGALAAAALVTLALIGAMEWVLAGRGFQPTIVDSDAEWVKQRRRASELGPRALVLIGASRMQLDLDLDTLRTRTGLEPVQLAIDGSSFLPVLEGLASDPRVVGTVLVDFTVQQVSGTPALDVAAAYQGRYAETPAPVALGFRSVEDRLAGLLHRSLRSYADGGSPLAALLTRVLDRDATPQYLITLPDRSRLADYRQVRMPEFYFGRVVRNLGGNIALPASLPAPERERILRAAIARIVPADDREFVQRLELVRSQAQAIEARGGHVVFLNLPSSGLVREADRAGYPPERFWRRLAESEQLRTFDVEDDPELARFECPDGSHLDYRDREAFTRRLVEALGLGRGAPGVAR